MISAKIRVESSEKLAGDLEKENKELLLNKSKLEASLEDALLGKVKGQNAVLQEPELPEKGKTEASAKQESGKKNKADKSASVS